MSRQNKIKNAVSKITSAIYELSEMNNSDIVDAKVYLKSALHKLGISEKKLITRKENNEKELAAFNQRQIGVNIDIRPAIKIIDQMISEQQKILADLEKIDQTPENTENLLD